jgi:2,3-bisphosphoglycerate-independent phosphoglycerate mutase
MKTILLLLDGLGDRSYQTLGHRTPLQAACTPNLDRLAGLGSNGLFHASLPGKCLPSEIAHYLLFGYNIESFPGRGLLEAVGADIPFQDTDVLCLAHLAGISWQEEVPVLVLGRKDVLAGVPETKKLFRSIGPYEGHGISIQLEQIGHNDAVLILSGEASPYVSDATPFVCGQSVARISPLANNPEPRKAEHTAKALNAYLSRAYRSLSKHPVNKHRQEQKLRPANFLATHRCGRRIPQDPFDHRWGMKGMLIASQSLYRGLAHELGLTFTGVKDTDKSDEDLRERISLALTAEACDFIHVHTKVPDEAAHTGDPKRKEAAIASLDRGLDELVQAVETRNDLLLVVTADHSTPSMGPLIHSGEPVPVTIVGPTVRRDAVKTFDEVSAARGCLGLLRGRELMLTLLNHANRSVMVGHRLGKEETPYLPLIYEPFKPKDES